MSRIKLKICQSILQQQYNTTNVVDSLLGCSFTQKTFEEEKQSLLSVDPIPLKDHFLP